MVLCAGPPNAVALEELFFEDFDAGNMNDARRDAGGLENLRRLYRLSRHQPGGDKCHICSGTDQLPFTDLKRMIRAEEKANKLPTKMTLATMMLTVPPLMAMLIGPSIYAIVTSLG